MLSSVLTFLIISHRKDTHCVSSPTLDSAQSIGDIHCDPSPAVLAAVLNAEDAQDLENNSNNNNHNNSTSYAEGVSSTFNPTSSETGSSGWVQETRTKHVMLLYSFSTAWLRTMGIVTSTAPILSPLPIAPDVYLFGEGVLSSRSLYTLRDGNGSGSGSGGTPSVPAIGQAAEPSASSTTLCVRSLALSEAAATPINASTTTNPSIGGAETKAVVATQVSDQYPLLLALRTAYDGADGEWLKVVFVSCHCYCLLCTALNYAHFC